MFRISLRKPRYIIFARVKKTVQLVTDSKEQSQRTGIKDVDEGRGGKREAKSGHSFYTLPRTGVSLATASKKISTALFHGGGFFQAKSN